MQTQINSNMGFYCAYLRKSRKDLDAEARGEGETLARHETRLKSFADSAGIKISKFYREIVSGETIASRPVMQELLADVENGMWAGVLVIEVERLARGNTLDQGIVSNTFQYSNTKIITPNKTYDPNNEFDEEYFEFGLFMSRREYKTINRRLHSGIIDSVSEGKHVGSAAPYGYEKYKLSQQKGYSLKIKPDEEKIIKYIYNSYINGNGPEVIAKELDKMGIKPKRSNLWGKSTIAHILENPVYIGKIKYTENATKKKNSNGKIIRVKNDTSNIIYVDGLHKPIIDLATWNKVQDIKNNNRSNRLKIDYSLKNPMSSILKCGICGSAMVRITYSSRNDIRICCKRCNKNVGSNIAIVEDKLLESLKMLLDEYELKLINNDNTDIELMLKINTESQDNMLQTLEKYQLQLNNVYDLLEQGVYSKEVFNSRLAILNSKIEETNKTLNQLKIKHSELEKSINGKKVFVPKIKKVIDTYYSTDDVSLKNKLLKSVLQKVDYTKVNPKSKDDFKLTLYPKLF